jgi:hypothetical protein
MATYKITFATLISNYAVVETLTSNEVAVGQAITVSGVSTSFDGSQTVYALPQYRFVGIDSDGDLQYDTNEPVENQVLYYFVADDVTRYAVIPQGTLDYTQTCTWITAQDIENYLTVPLLGSGDQTFLGQCASAANNFCFRRRQESGYVDQLTVSPGGDVTLGTIMYASALFRQKGSIDQFASFTDMGSAPVVGLSGIVKQLLGISRPQVA